MLETSLELLKKIEDAGYEAYIVGGFVRDYYMGKESLDVDICTNAKPKDLSKIFKEAIIPIEKYGAVSLVYKKVTFEITTFRKEIKYTDNRKPIEIQYIDSLVEDIKRRDFTINTICMNSKGEIIDLLGGKKDIDNKIIRMVDNADIKLKEDVLRILRAVRFATNLNFKLDVSVKQAIIKYRELLSNLSYTRKKDELTKIFVSPNAKYGIKLLCDLGLDQYLNLSNLKGLRLVDDILGIWAELKIINIYPFSKTERETITKINEVLDSKRIDAYLLYKYGLYIVSIAAAIRGINKKVIIKMYDNLPIKSRHDIDIDVNTLCSILNRKPGKWISEVYNELEKSIIYRRVSNDKESLCKYIMKENKIHAFE